MYAELVSRYISEPLAVLAGLEMGRVTQIRRFAPGLDCQSLSGPPDSPLNIEKVCPTLGMTHKLHRF